MALLSVDTFLLMYDDKYIKDLASRFDATVGGLCYKETVVELAISQAASQIAGALAKLYSAAQIEADGSLQRICGDLALYFLEQSRGKVSAGARMAYEAALGRLQRLQNGDEILATVSQLLPTAVNVAPLTNVLYDDDYFEGLSDDNEEIA